MKGRAASVSIWDSFESTSNSHVQRSLLVCDGLNDSYGNREEERDEQCKKESPRRHVAGREEEDVSELRRKTNDI